MLNVSPSAKSLSHCEPQRENPADCRCPSTAPALSNVPADGDRRAELLLEILRGAQMIRHRMRVEIHSTVSPFSAMAASILSKLREIRPARSS